MKIAIASSGKNLDSLVDARFGRCPYFLIVDPKTQEFEIIKNTAEQSLQGAGISAAQLVLNQKVKAVIAGNFGPKAVMVLAQGKVKIFPISGKMAKAVIKDFNEGKLKPAPNQILFGQAGSFGETGPDSGRK